MAGCPVTLGVLPAGRAVSARTAFWYLAAAYTVVMAAGTAPTPLWPLYEVTAGVGTTTVSALAGAVVIGALVSFLFLGHLSDRHGRRQVLVPALLTSALAMAVMAAFPTIPGLLAGRVLTGLALGVTAPTATAYLFDLHRATPGGVARPALPATVATLANLGGLALGPVLAGTLADLLPAPLITSFSVLATALVAFAVALLRFPETVVRAGNSLSRPARFALLPGQALRFAGGASGGFVSFAVTGTFATLGAIVVRSRLSVHSVFVWGLAAALVFASSAVAQLAVARWPAGRLFAVGVGLLWPGLALLVSSVAQVSLSLYLLSAIVTGAGCGLLFKAGLLTSTAVAVPESRAGVLAIHFSTAYVGMGLGALGVAGLEDAIGTVAAFGVVSAVLAVVALGGAAAAGRGLEVRAG